MYCHGATDCTSWKSAFAIRDLNPFFFLQESDEDLVPLSPVADLTPHIPTPIQPPSRDITELLFMYRLLMWYMAGREVNLQLEHGLNKIPCQVSQSKWSQRPRPWRSPRPQSLRLYPSSPRPRPFLPRWAPIRLHQNELVLTPNKWYTKTEPSSGLYPGINQTQHFNARCQSQNGVPSFESRSVLNNPNIHSSPEECRHVET